MYQSNFGIYFFSFFCVLGVVGIWMSVNLTPRTRSWNSGSYTDFYKVVKQNHLRIKTSVNHFGPLW
jgi:hypothetical protein